MAIKAGPGPRVLRARIRVEVAPGQVLVGVDTHKHAHTAVVVDHAGQALAGLEVPNTPAGFIELWRWASELGSPVAVGIEGAGSYGIRLTRWLAEHTQVQVFEVPRPSRQARRGGKSDLVDAEHAARAVLSGMVVGTPKRADGQIEAIRALRIARTSAMKARTQARNQLGALAMSAPEPLAAELAGLRGVALARRARTLGVSAEAGPVVAATITALRVLGVRIQQLTQQITELDAQLTELIAARAPQLLELTGVGVDTAGALLVAAGDNPERITTEAAFAALCGVCPLEASSGQHRRHRLNRGGDRAANHALWRIALVRLRHDSRTQQYKTRRQSEGRTTPEIIRCLKRYIAREIYRTLTAP